MAEETTQPQKVQLTISQLKADLKAGIDRKGIGEKYGLNRAQVIRLFQNEKLKGLKVHKPVEPAFELIDDDTTTEIATAAVKKAPAKKAAPAKAATESNVELTDDTAQAEDITAPAPKEEVAEGKW